MHSLSEKAEQAALLSRRLEKLLGRRRGLHGQHLPVYRRLVQEQEQRNDELRARVGAAEDAERDLHAGSMGPLLNSLPPELAGRVAALAERSSRAACVALRSSHDAHATAYTLTGTEMADEVVVACPNLATLHMDDSDRALPTLRAAAARGQLRHLDVNCMGFSDASVLPLPLALAGIAGLESLSFKIPEDLQHPDRIAANLAQALRGLGRLTRLELRNVPPVSALTASLPALSQLRCVKVGKVGGRNADAFEKQLAPALQLLTSLTSLSLVQCGISNAAAAAALAAVLRRMPGLTHLDLGMSSMTPEGEAKVYVHHTWNNALCGIGASLPVLAQAIQGLPGLRSLGFEGCAFDPDAPAVAAHLLPMLAALTGLQVLNWSYNRIVAPVFPILARMTGLRDLRLKGCVVTRGCGIALAQSLPSFGCLERLDVRRNNLDVDTTFALVSAASTHMSLKRVNVFPTDGRYHVPGTRPWDDETVRRLKDLVGDRCKLA